MPAQLSQSEQGTALLRREKGLGGLALSEGVL